MNKIDKIVNEIWKNYNTMDEDDFCNYMSERFGVYSKRKTAGCGE